MHISRVTKFGDSFIYGYAPCGDRSHCDIGGCEDMQFHALYGTDGFFSGIQEDLVNWWLRNLQRRNANETVL